jgi:hypothetical protein
MKYKIDDLVEENDGFVAVLVKKLKDGYWKVVIPMDKYYKEVWHEEDFKLCKEEEL